MKIGIFIDGITLFHGLKSETNVEINFVYLKNWLKESNEITSCCYFNAVENTETKKSFFTHVYKSGFTIYIRKPIKDFLLKKLDVNEMNIELAIEAFAQKDNYDKLIIVSGKHHFLPLCEKLAMLGKEIEIVGFKNNINKCFDKYNQRYLDDFINKERGV